jgi:hypothetical protein
MIVGTTRAMGRHVDRLSATGLKSKVDGLHHDGRGLYLQVKNGGKSWVFRYMLNGKSRYMGLGPYPGVTLAEARRPCIFGVDKSAIVNVDVGSRRFASDAAKARWHQRRQDETNHHQVCRRLSRQIWRRTTSSQDGSRNREGHSCGRQTTRPSHRDRQPLTRWRQQSHPQTSPGEHNGFPDAAGRMAASAYR